MVVMDHLRLVSPFGPTLAFKSDNVGVRSLYVGGFPIDSGYELIFHGPLEVHNFKEFQGFQELQFTFRHPGVPSTG